MSREPWRDARRVLAVRLDNVGDIVMLGPALRTLKQEMPQAQISLLASPAGSVAASLLPWIDDVMTWRASWQDASNKLPVDGVRELALVSQLQERHFDAAFIFTSFSQSAWPPAYACYLAGIPTRVAQAKDFGGSLLTRVVKPLPDCVHQVDRNLHLLEAMGMLPPQRHLDVVVPQSARDSAATMLEGLGLPDGAPFIVVAPGASCPARRYDAWRYSAVLSLMARRHHLPLLLVGHPREQTLIEEIARGADAPGVFTCPRDVSLAELTAIIARARLLIANNSGPMHLADAVRCPMVILFSGSDLEEQWQPRNAPAYLLRRPTPCEPCYRFECPFHMECLDIPPRDVARACEEMLERTAHRTRVSREVEETPSRDMDETVRLPAPVLPGRPSEADARP